MNFKRICTGITIAVMLSGSTFPAFAENGATGYYKSAVSTTVTAWNAPDSVISHDAVIQNGRVMLPVHPIAEALGWSVEVNEYGIYLNTHSETALIPQKRYYSHYESVIGLVEDEPFIQRSGILGDIDMHHFFYEHYPKVHNEVCPGLERCIERAADAAVPLSVTPFTVDGEVFVATDDLEEALYANIEWYADANTVAIRGQQLPYYDGNGLPAEYREYLWRKTLEKHPDAVTYDTAQSIAKTKPEPQTISKKSFFDLRAFESEIFRLTNEVRKSEGLEPLQSDSALDTAVVVRAGEMLEEYSHTRPDGTKCETVLDECGIDLTYSGENIAYNMVGLSPESTARGFMSIWLHSKGHRANILNPESKYISVGASLGEGERIYCVQIFAR